MFNAWTISYELFTWIRNNLPTGKTILELGSGNGTAELLKYYKVYSIEHDPAWLNKTKSNYIHAPIVMYPGGYDWYDVSELMSLPEYDLLLVDGPTGSIGREGFIEHLDLFNLDVPIIIDDTHRSAEWKIALTLSQLYNRKLKHFFTAGRKFSVLTQGPVHEPQSTKS